MMTNQWQIDLQNAVRDLEARVAALEGKAKASASKKKAAKKKAAAK